MKYDTDPFFDLSLDMLVIAGTDGYFKRVNPSFERVLGWTSGELLAHPFLDFVHPEDLDATLNEVGKLSSGIPTVSFENRYRCADGSYRDFWWTACPQHGTGLIYCVAKDFTTRKEAEERASRLTAELKAANEKLVCLATTDALTGVKNRRAFDEQLAYLMSVTHRTAASVSLLMVDVDHFKSYNDRYGHQAGDSALVTIASLLRQGTRTSDVVARYGGEEFAVILPDTPAEAGVDVGEKLRYAVQGHRWDMKPLTISVGVSTASFGKAHGTTPTVDCGPRIILEADQALYRSKSRGRNATTHILLKTQGCHAA